ncbi:Sau3AI family type II restriction endonuclease [Pelistega indica]|uniref:Sau3AI family type II restriction endonuclease n=1 Tax=Pelistega indica TaxID=1414851 RepID=UPI0004176D0E|nr:Sau3AI family type II restriction endonuclease [Pelistega indica]
MLKNDLAIIKEDFKIIAQKIRAGLAHELSEGDTRYLGACTKGATAEKSLQPQFYNPHQLAKRRAYSLKQSYMTFVLNNYVFKQSDEYESIFKPNELVTSSFDDEIEKKLSFYYGMDEQSLYQRFDLLSSSAKQKNKMLVNRMLGINTDAAEFRKANIIVKTIRVQKNGLPKESMSFANVPIVDFMSNEFDDSQIYQFFEEARFLFVIFNENDEGKYILRKSMFWNMPLTDLENIVKKEWQRYKTILLEGVKFTFTPRKIINNLPNKKDTRVFHLRPRARNAAYIIDGVKYGRGEERDMDTLPNGDKMTAQCFWLNNDYIASVIR